MAIQLQLQLYIGVWSAYIKYRLVHTTCYIGKIASCYVNCRNMATTLVPGLPRIGALQEVQIICQGCPKLYPSHALALRNAKTIISYSYYNNQLQLFIITELQLQFQKVYKYRQLNDQLAISFWTRMRCEHNLSNRLFLDTSFSYIQQIQIVLS